MSSVTDQNQIGQCIAEQHKGITHVDDRFAQLAGAEKSGLIGQSLDQIVQLPERVKSSLHPRQNAFILPGFYTVRLKPSNKSVSVRIDEMDSPMHKQYTIVTITEDAVRKVNEEKKFEKGFLGLVKTICETEETKDDYSGRPPKNPAQILEDFKHFFDLTIDLFFILDPDFCFLETNRSFRQLLNLTEDDLLGRHLTDFIHPEDQEAYLKFLETDKKDAYPSPVMPVRIHTGDNNYQWLEGSGRKVGNRYYCAMYDISTRRENEAALKRREEQLADAQALAHMGHWHWQVGDDHLTGSDEMFRIFGVDQESTSSPVDQFHDLVHPDDLPRLQASFRKAVVNGTDVEFEFRIRQPGGELRHIHCEGRCELGDNGRTLALFGFVQDITEQKEAESELRLAKEAAEAAYQTKSRFLANMSHELRTPLNAIIGFAEMMEEELLGPLGNDSYDDYIQGIRQSGELLLDLITDILDMSKMEMGKYDIQRDEMDLIKAVRLSIHMVETRANEAGLTIQSQIPDNLDFVYADRRAVMQILLNLLSNAVKFTNPGGEIMVGVKHISDHIQLTVRDTGIGIPADKLDQVTRPFEQVSHEMTRRHNGTGLGLAITQSLVDLHDGQMMIDSQEDVGTTVKVTLPTSIGQNNDGK